MARRATFWAVTLRMLCAVALLSLGLAHKPASAAPTLLELAAYTLPDGTFADICIDDAVHGKVKHSLPERACEACRIANAMLLPLPSGLGALPPVVFEAAVPPRAGPVVSARRERPGAVPRAPPAPLA